MGSASIFFKLCDVQDCRSQYSRIRGGSNYRKNNRLILILRLKKLVSSFFPFFFFLFVRGGERGWKHMRPVDLRSGGDADRNFSPARKRGRFVSTIERTGWPCAAVKIYIYIKSHTTQKRVSRPAEKPREWKDKDYVLCCIMISTSEQSIPAHRGDTRSSCSCRGTDVHDQTNMILWTMDTNNILWINKWQDLGADG